MFSQFTYQQIIVTPIVAFPSCSSSFLGRQRICFSKYFSPFPPQVFFSSTKICSLLQIFYALSFFVFLNLHKRDILFLTSIKEIFYISICSKKNCWRVAITYSVLSLYLFIDRNKDCRRRQSRSIPGQKFALRQLHLHYWPADPFRRRREMFS